MKIGGIVQNRNLTFYLITSLDDQPGMAAEVLEHFAGNRINLEYITEQTANNGKALMAFCVADSDAARVEHLLKDDHALTTRFKIRKTEHVGVIGVYGPHFREKPAIAALFCRVLGSRGINILGMSSSISSVCCVVRADRMDAAREALLEQFELP